MITPFLLQNDTSEKKFYIYKKKAQDLYKELKSYRQAENYVHTVWKNYVDELEKYFLSDFDIGFLRHPLILNTMFVWGVSPRVYMELNFLKNYWTKDKLSSYLRENSIGKPILGNIEYSTSSNSVHHLYHLSLFECKTKVKLGGIKSVVEWGGGYGNMAKIFRRINRDVTYTIIDLPLFTCIQYIYLSCIFGEERIKVIKENEQNLKGNFNLIPINQLEQNSRVSFLGCDLFISTWGLSESTRYAQNYVIEKDFYSARNILFAFHEKYPRFPDYERIMARLVKEREYIYSGKIPFSSIDRYAFFGSRLGPKSNSAIE